MTRLLVLRTRSLIVVTLSCAAVLAGCAHPASPAADAGDAPVAWPQQGQSALWTSSAGLVGTSGSHRSAPIASLAKVMTAYLVLRAHPLPAGSDGFALTISDDEVADTKRRRQLDQSLVAVQVGERLTERQALQALLLPSANNMAAILAVRTFGSQAAFVARMNAQATRLGMRDTIYTDPSGYDARTVSTAGDQLILARAAMRVPAFAQTVGQRFAIIPVAGRITNTDTLLGRDGFIGVKTGSHDAAGGCFMFASAYRLHGRTVVVTGVVLGQRGGPLIGAALDAARRLVDSVRAPTLLVGHR